MTADAAPPREISGAILEAASQARIGVAVSFLQADGQMETAWLSDVAVQIIGWPREALIGAAPRDIFAPEERAAFDERARRRGAGEGEERPYETVFVQESGRRVPVEISVALTEVAGRRATVVFLRDISARHATDQALAASEARFRRLVESAPDGVAISRDGVLLYVNDAAVRLLGYDAPTELLCRSMAELLLPEDFAAMIAHIRAARTSSERQAPREYRAIRRDGTIAIAEITSDAIDYDGAPATLAFARDVTDRARMREQLARVDRLAALGTLAAGIAHEINNPLAYVTLGLQRLERQLAAGSELVELRSELAQLRSGVDRVADIVRDLRAFSRDDVADDGVADVVAAVETAARLTSHELRMRATLSVQIDGRPFVHGARGKIEQVVMNLLVNAAHAMPAGRTDGKIELCARTEGDRVVLTVRDDGRGIPPESLARVFDPFFTTKPVGEGTGLGLAICHRIVTQLGGDITIVSAPERGTDVRLSLRAATPPPAVTPSAGTRLPAEHATLAILVVDDEPLLARGIARLLRAHTVTVATSGDEALAHLGTGAVCDVVVCDVRMPGTTGPQLYESVRSSRPDLANRFIFMTGGAVGGMTDGLPSPLLRKPFTAESLEAAIRGVTQAR